MTIVYSSSNKRPRLIDSLELFEVMELEVEIWELPCGERIIRFVDCTNDPPEIPGWAFDRATAWLREKRYVDP